MPRRRGPALTPRWTFRDWLLPWCLVALSTISLVAGSPSLPAAAANLVLLGAIPLRREPWRLPRWAPYALTIPFLAAFALQLSALREHGTGWDGLFTYPGWYFAVLAGLQAGALGRSTRPAQAAWSSLAAQILSGPVAGPARIGACILQVSLLLVLLRAVSFRGGSARTADRRLLPAVALSAVVALVFWSQGGRFAGAVSSHGRYRGPSSLKGFSPVSVLGTFRDEFGDRDEEVAVRAWSERPLPFLQGAVLDLYGAGAWRRSGRVRVLESPRNVGEAGVFCTDSRDPGDSPDGWLSLELPTESHVPRPSGSPCVGMVTDSVLMWPSGAMTSPGGEFGRGVWWWDGVDRDTLSLPTDLAVPRGLEGLLDSALLECGVRRGTPVREAARGIGRWFAGRYAYTLVPGRAAGEDPLRRFARERKGYCEYFASLATLMLRRSGTPARYATGFAYPDRGPGGSWVFRRGNAHAWVLVRDPDRGWIPFDPTPSSDRPPVSRSPARRWLQDLEGRLVVLWHGIRDGNWRKWLDAAAEFQDRNGGWIAGAGIAAGIAAAVAAAFRRRRGTADGNPWERRLRTAESLLARRGHLRRPGETVGRFLARLPPDAPKEAVEALRDYQARRFAPGNGEEVRS